MTGQAAGTIWPSAYPPAAEAVLTWRLRDVAELPGVRAEVRARLSGPGLADLLDRLVLALDEMASNALRHGGGEVRATLRTTGDAYLLEVTDQAAQHPPEPAVGRDPSLGGLGLYLIAELAAEHGWYADGAAKHVWALLRR
ncbi:ATP-binding protein [Blastococcus sp. MG754426]|uniref:ATP-binding protein n=1 Tax=unclassified Blastococcus TaxID=2619396 RepID=UPI001EF12BEA|nr:MULTISPECIES: ATP-binding protein [unclassified Blastococcus]MCF6509322.1 ATP-binding protein [Blastococcus sp. MG754426]MCF6513401.1 ATP-binding protein [Blastococcus sp. MG754427]MCF6736686.1 ATP-binding protein [Blastococcus sp. KM273129]